MKRVQLLLHAKSCSRVNKDSASYCGLKATRVALTPINCSFLPNDISTPGVRADSSS